MDIRDKVLLVERLSVQFEHELRIRGVDDHFDQIQLCKEKLSRIQFSSSQQRHDEFCGTTEIIEIDATVSSIFTIMQDHPPLASEKDLHESNWNGRIPDALYMMGMVGEVEKSRIAHDVDPFFVRGKSYAKDSKKVTSSSPLFYLRGIQIVQVPQFQYHVAKAHWSGLPAHLPGDPNGNEWFIMNYLVPGATCVQVVCFFTASSEAAQVIKEMRQEESDSAAAAAPAATAPSSLSSSAACGGVSNSSNSSNSSNGSGSSSSTSSGGVSSSGAENGHNNSNSKPKSDTLSKATAASGAAGGSGKGTPVSNAPWVSLLKRFWTGDQVFCDSRFKMVPKVVKGSWPVKVAVGQKPALTGTKLVQKYFRGDNYFEVDLDISSSAIANGILGVVRGAAKGMVVEIAIVIQGETAEELPEAVLCQARFDHMDLEKTVSVPSAQPLQDQRDQTKAADSSAVSGVSPTLTPVAGTEKAAAGKDSTKKLFGW